jgi:hypothetical protein
MLKNTSGSFTPRMAEAIREGHNEPAVKERLRGIVTGWQRIGGKQESRKRRELERIAILELRSDAIAASDGLECGRSGQALTWQIRTNVCQFPIEPRCRKPVRLQPVQTEMANVLSSHEIGRQVEERTLPIASIANETDGFLYGAVGSQQITQDLPSEWNCIFRKDLSDKSVDLWTHCCGIESDRDTNGRQKLRRMWD